jgi:sugar/nucleoside kinase (ribokinase family)
VDTTGAGDAFLGAFARLAAAGVALPDALAVAGEVRRALCAPGVTV